MKICLNFLTSFYKRRGHHGRIGAHVTIHVGIQRRKEQEHAKMRQKTCFALDQGQIEVFAVSRLALRRLQVSLERFSSDFEWSLLTGLKIVVCDIKL